MPTDLERDYLTAMRRESETETYQATALMQYGIADSIASLVDPDSPDWHLDVHSRAGEVGMRVAQLTNRRTITLVRKPSSAQDSVMLALGMGVPVQAHIFPEPREQRDHSVRMEPSIDARTLYGLDLKYPGMLTILNETMQTRQGLEYILSIDPDIHSMTWCLPSYRGRSYRYEFPPGSDEYLSMAEIMKRDRENILQFAALNIHPGGQLILARNVGVETKPDQTAITNEEEQRLEHWKSYWDLHKQMLVLSSDRTPMTAIGQPPDSKYNGVNIAVFRRNENKEIDAFLQSNRILGIGQD